MRVKNQKQKMNLTALLMPNRVNEPRENTREANIHKKKSDVGKTIW